MINIFTRHTQEQGITYLQHMVFALEIALRLLHSGVAFTLHGLFPFIDIKQRLDLEATSAFLAERNEWIENAGDPDNLDYQNQVA